MTQPRSSSAEKIVAPAPPTRAVWGLSGYQWLVLLAAWLGWGFDVFDGLLFNYVAPTCVPQLLHISAGAPGAGPKIVYWTGALTSALLIGWAAGGVLFGLVADRFGRTRTLLFTMLTYAVATAACAMAPNLWLLGLFRFVASLGIGGEWAAGASLVAETMPENKRVAGGALLYTSAPAGLFLATFVNDLFLRRIHALASNPATAWRLVFLTGLVPAAFAIAIRLFVREPEAWTGQQREAAPKVRELFAPALRRRTIGGLAMAMVALVTWWSCSAFITAVAKFLTHDPSQVVRHITLANDWFNVGGLVGTLLCIPVAERLGRRPMFLAYFALSAVAVAVAFGAPLEVELRLKLMGLVGLTVFGIFGSFTFYLPELFPTRLRGTGAGFCYNTGRLVTAFFPFAVGWIALSGANPLHIIRWIAVVPALGVGLLLLGFGEETKGELLR